MIRREEIYRREVRDELEREAAGSKGWKKRLWEGLNSNFVIWGLSAVALGLVTWGHEQWKAEAAERKERKRVFDAVCDELESRIHPYSYALWDMKTTLEGKVREGDKPDPALAEAMVRLYRQAEDPETPAHPQFRGRGLLSLLIEFERIAKEEGYLKPFQGWSSKHVQEAKLQAAALKTLHAELPRDPRPSALLVGAKDINRMFFGGLGQIAGPPPAPVVEDPGILLPKKK